MNEVNDVINFCIRYSATWK